MRAQDLDFNIDRYINRIIPRNRLYLLPKPISWILGYRDSTPPLIGNVVVWWWAFIGAFAGILIVEAVFRTEQLRSEGTPIIIASLVYSHPYQKLRVIWLTKNVGCSSNPRVPYNRVTPLPAPQCHLRPGLLRNSRNRHH